MIVFCTIEKGSKLPAADCTWHDKCFLRDLRPPLQTKDLSCVDMMVDQTFPRRACQKFVSRMHC